MEQLCFFDSIAQYQQISALLHRCTGEELLKLAAEGLQTGPEALGQTAARVQADDGGPLRYGEALTELARHVSRLDWVYRALADQKSRLVFYDQVLARLLPDLPPDRLPVDTGTCPFFDRDFLAGEPETLPEGQDPRRWLLDNSRRVREEAPALAIRLLDRSSQLWLLPRLLDCLNHSYRLYLRYDRPGPDQSVLLWAVPPADWTAPAPSGRHRTILALCYERGWHNAELVKDRMCIPYLFHKLYGYDVRVIGERVDADYSNLQYIPGLDVEFVDCWDNQAKYSYLAAHAGELDLITLPECQYGLYAPLIQLYRQKNPAGRVLLTLDANSGWADRVPQEDPSFRYLMDHCDLIGASSRSIQAHLNAKWPWPIEYVPNGFYDFSHSYQPPVFDEKENVILTVGRLGTLAKATDTLLNAFTRIAGDLPDWKLRLVGPVAPEFRPWLEGFAAQHGDLMDQIEFAGPVMDRAQLYREYRRAKVFALPSRFEGTPNVMAEALVHGCATCFTRIDTCPDAIDQGRCGTCADVDDVEGYAQALLELCRSPRLREFSERACLLGRTDLDMERAVARLNSMLFGEEEHHGKY